MTPWTGSRVSPLPLTSVKCGSVGDTSRKIWKKIGFKRTTNKSTRGYGFGQPVVLYITSAGIHQHQHISYRIYDRYICSTSLYESKGCVNSLTLIDDELSINQVTLSSFLSGENHLLSHDLGWESCQLFKSRQMCGTQELVHRHVSHRHIHIFLYTVFRYIHIVVLDVCGFQIITYVLSVKCPYIMFQCFFSKVTLHQMISKRDRDIMSKYLKAHGEV